MNTIENLSVEKYFDNSRQHILWQYVCTLLELSPTKANGEAVRNAIKGYIIRPEE